MTRLDAHSIRQSEDSFVDKIFERAPYLGAPLLRAHFPRAYLDVNREPYELDPLMFHDALPANYNISSPRVVAGLGTIARIVAENKGIYRDKLSLEDAQMRIHGIYLPYHETLQKLLSDTLGEFGVAILIDCHSMPRLAPSRKRNAAEIILGDRFGTSCAPGLMETARSLFKNAGLKVGLNHPYAGGYITRTYGRPEHGVHTLQIEISRHLYMNENTRRPNKHFDEIKRIATQLISTFTNMDLQHLSPKPVAAE